MSLSAVQYLKLKRKYKRAKINLQYYILEFKKFHSYCNYPWYHLKLLKSYLNAGRNVPVYTSRFLSKKCLFLPEI